VIAGVLTRYIGRRFLRTVLAVFGGVFFLIFTVDLVETLRRSGETPGANGFLMAWLSLLHTPIIAEQVLPFAVLLGSMIAFLNLTRRLELVVARAAGVSVWQFLAPPLIVALAIGIVEVTTYNPLSTAMKREADAFEAKIFGGRGAVGGAGVWLRQQSVDGQSIIHADVNAGKDDSFLHFQAFNFSSDGAFEQRVDADSATLHDGYWKLEGVTVVTPGFDTQPASVYLLATSLTRTEVAQAFVAPETVSFWRLAALAEQVERAGLDATPYRLRYQQLIASPVLLAAMVLVAACFSLRLFRMGGVQQMVYGGVAAGFVLYVSTKIVGDLGGVGVVSPAVAGWSPAVVGCLFGVYVLLHQEDG
jgi:lipopolysaccharide export system permease protein